jgi:hypothetical protein
MVIDNTSTIKIYIVKVANMYVKSYLFDGDTNDVEDICLGPDITSAQIIDNKSEADAIAKVSGGKTFTFIQDHWGEKTTK